MLCICNICFYMYLWMLFFRESYITNLDPSVLFYFTMHIVDHERVEYCIPLHLTLNHLTLATKYMHTFLSKVNRVAY